MSWAINSSLLRVFVPSCESTFRIPKALTHGIFSHEGTKARRSRGDSS
jgi:hypothetical protein